MKPTSKADITSEEHSLPDTGSADSEKVNSFLLRRHLATIRRKAPELCNKHGDVIDPNSPSFLLDICKEMDRALLRTVKDTPLPLHYLNYKDNNGTTPLSYLCQKGDFVLVRMLCEMKGIDVNVQDSEGNTPLMLASQGGHSSLVTFLLESFKTEIDLNRRNAFGFTALMKAALQGRLKCVKSLLQAGANVSLKDPNKGYTALEWSLFCGRKSCSEAIKNHLKSTTSKNSKRLSQALNETENWFKARLSNNGAAGNGPRNEAGVTSISILASATGTSALCASLPIVSNMRPDEETSEGEHERRSLVIPAIQVTTQD